MADQDLQTPPTDANNNDAQNSPGKDAGESIETLRARLAASDRTITKLRDQVGKFQGIMADREFEFSETKQKLSENTAKLTEFETNFAKLNGELEQAKTAAATAGRQVQRTKLLATDYSDLMEFEADGLLDQNLEGDDFKNYLDKFRTKMGTTRQAAVQKTLQGTSPVTPPTRDEGEVTVAVLDKQIDDAYAKGDTTLGLKLSFERAKLMDKK